MNDSRYRNTSAINYLSLSQRSAAVVEIGLKTFRLAELDLTERPIHRARWLFDVNVSQGSVETRFRSGGSLVITLLQINCLVGQQKISKNQSTFRK